MRPQKLPIPSRFLAKPFSMNSLFLRTLKLSSCSDNYFPKPFQGACYMHSILLNSEKMLFEYLILLKHFLGVHVCTLFHSIPLKPGDRQ